MSNSRILTITCISYKERISNRGSETSEAMSNAVMTCRTCDAYVFSYLVTSALISFFESIQSICLFDVGQNKYRKGFRELVYNG